jgi:hypothetical protein
MPPMIVPIGPAMDPTAAPASTPEIPAAASPTGSATPGWSSCFPSALSLALSSLPSVLPGMSFLSVIEFLPLLDTQEKSN